MVLTDDQNVSRWRERVPVADVNVISWPMLNASIYLKVEEVLPRKDDTAKIAIKISWNKQKKI